MRNCYVLIMGGIFFFLGCNKKENQILECDPDIYAPCELNINLTPVVDTCFELLPEPNVGWNRTGENIFFNNAGYNYSNPDAFLFLGTQREPNEKEIYQVNFCTGIQTKITDYTSSFNNLKWGSKDWILFIQPDLSLGIMKSSGDSLTQITNSHKYFNPDWLEDGERIFSGVLFDDGTGEIKSVILNKEGTIIDTFNINAQKARYFQNKVAAYHSISASVSGHLGYFDLTTKEFINLFEVGSPAQTHRPLSIDWLNDEHIIWSDIFGVYKININSSEPDTLIENCDNQSFYNVSASPNMDGKVILTFVESENPDSSTLYSESNIIIFDTNTGEKNIIDLN